MSTSATSAPAVARGRLRLFRLSSLTQYAGFVPALVLFGLFGREDALGKWDLVIAAPWLSRHDSKAVDEFFSSRDRAAMERAAAASARRYSWPEYAAVFAALLDRR